jgi:alanine racemase
MAVVKADAYGHGAVPVAEAALAAGADCLAVALVQEGIELRRAGIEDPILVLSEQPDSQVGDIVSHGLIATAYSVSFIDALEREVRKRNVVGHEVHLKVDTGMNRVGVHPSEAVERAGRIVACGPWLSLTGLYTHFATADDIDSTFAAEQLRRFETVLEGVRRAGIDIETVHAANSAGALLLPESRLDMVRLGISMYGIAPSESLESACADLRPALSLKSNVSYVKRVGAGEGVSYGSRYRCSSTTTIATVPIGYADGIARRSGLVGVEVLIGGRRHPIVGVVTMDQLMVDVGDAEIAVGDEVVLIGGQGGESISANEIAHRLGTIGYEVVCALADRLPRRYTEM